MRHRSAIRSAGLAVVATACAAVLFLSPRGQSQLQPTPALTTDEKLNLILSRLDKIEKRLAALEPNAAGDARKARPIEIAPSPRDSARRTSAELPFMAEKPKPHSSTFKGCGARGDGGDPDLNFLKNRVDEADEWKDVPFDAILGQAYPKGVGRHNRSEWDPTDLAEVQRNEGLPVRVVCYFAWAKDEGPESCNCHIEDKAMYDIHTWLVSEPARIDDNKPPDRHNAVVAEVTPRLKPSHPQWTQGAIRKLAKSGTKVRVSGWLLLDQEHPEQLKPAGSRPATRGTLWEIHPIMDIEVWKNGEWVSLDD